MSNNPPGRKPSPLTPILQLVRDEIARQDEKWGSQRDLPLNGGRIPEAGQRYAAGRELEWKGYNASRSEEGFPGWDGILYEEAFEAMAAETLEDRVAELVQVAAVAVNAILSLQHQATSASA